MNGQRKYLDDLIILRGGGDIATGVAVRLYNSGFQVLILETESPSFIRRTVSLGMAVYEGNYKVEDIESVLVDSFDQSIKDRIQVIVDPQMDILKDIRPLALVDACIAKKNNGLSKDLNEIVVAMGPGFEAGKDCHAVVETMRGHDLGRLIYSGQASPDTKTPGIINGVGKERVLHSPAEGCLSIVKDIGSTVDEDEVIANVDGATVKSPIDGLIRGMIKDGYKVFKGMKIADVDPRIDQYENCFKISDKARALGGSVLEAVLYLKRNLI